MCREIVPEQTAHLVFGAVDCPPSCPSIWPALSSSRMDEAALIQAAKKGDLDAFNRLVLALQDLAGPFKLSDGLGQVGSVSLCDV